MIRSFLIIIIKEFSQPTSALLSDVNFLQKSVPTFQIQCIHVLSVTIKLQDIYKLLKFFKKKSFGSIYITAKLI